MERRKQQESELGPSAWNKICKKKLDLYMKKQCSGTTGVVTPQKWGVDRERCGHPVAPYTLGFWHEETHRRLAAPDAAAGRAHGSAREGAEQRAGTADQWAAWRAKMPPKTDNDDAFSEYVANPAYQFYK